MKKSILVCLLFSCMCFGLYADSVEDVQFKQYVEMTRKSEANSDGMTVCADPAYRIIFASMPIPLNYASVTPQVVQAMKKEMLAAIAKQEADCKIIKDLKISVVYTFITSDKGVFSIAISYKDL